jgi:hypothetical protein
MNDPIQSVRWQKSFFLLRRIVMFAGPVLRPVPDATTRRRRCEERLAAARRQCPDAMVGVDAAAVSFARVEATSRRAYQRHVRAPELEVRDLVRLAFEEATKVVNMDLWRERREARDAGSTLAPPAPYIPRPPPQPPYVLAPTPDGAAAKRRLPRPFMVTRRREEFELPPLPACDAPLTRADIMREPLLDTYALPALPGGEPIQATLVNSVFMVNLRGSTFRFPWQGDEERQRCLPVASVTQSLLGVACPYAASGNRSFCIRYKHPLGTKHSIFPLDMSIHETAASNDALSEFAVALTTALLSLGCGLPYLRIERRVRHNCVFTAYAPYPIDYTLLKEKYPSMVEIKESHFKSTVCWDPSIELMKLLVFRNRPVILVGARNASEMGTAMDFFLPRIYQACVRPQLPLPPPPPLPDADDVSLDMDLFRDVEQQEEDEEEERRYRPRQLVEG